MGRGTFQAGAALSCVSAVLALVACSGSSDDDTAPGSNATASSSSPLDGKRIAQILFSTDAYQVAHGRHVTEYAQSLGASVDTQQGNLDATRQNKQVEDAAIQGYDAMMLQPVDPSAVVGPINNALQLDVKVTAWAIKPAEPIKVPYLDLNEYPLTVQAGEHAAEGAKKFFPDEPVRALVIDIPTLPICSELRMQGFIDGLEKADPEATVYRVGVGTPDRQLVLQRVEDFIQSNEPFNVFTACNGEMLLGGVDALKAAGRGKAEDKVPQTEYIFSLGIEGNDELLDQSSSVMEVQALTPKANAKTYVDMVSKVMSGDIALDEGYTESMAGGLLLEPDCEFMNEFMKVEYYETTPYEC